MNTGCCGRRRERKKTRKGSEDQVLRRTKRIMQEELEEMSIAMGETGIRDEVLCTILHMNIVFTQIQKINCV